jgi:ASC-1-like (ASCH) protein
MKSKEIKLKIIEAGHRAVEQLIKVAKEAIIKHDPEDDLSADRLKNAAATKKLAIFDAFEILNRIEEEKNLLEDKPKVEEKKEKSFKGFAEGRSK